MLFATCRSRDRRNRSAPSSLAQLNRILREQPEDPTLLAVITPFTPRFQTVTTGNIALIGNTVLTASPTDPNAISAQNGPGSKLNNADFAGKLVYLDVDSDATTFDSSRADLSIPAGSTVLFAGLYWGGFSKTTAPRRR
jgi:hypothetical protein